MHLMNLSSQATLEAITGPMFAGKSEIIAQRIKRIDYFNRFTANKPIIYTVYRPRLDKRPNHLREIPYSGWAYTDIDSLPDDCARNDLIIIDEAQFMTMSVILDINHLLRAGKHIIVAGLDKDYMGRPFCPFMECVLATCDECTKLTAICVQCGETATMTKLLTDEDLAVDTNVMVESETVKYAPVCRACHRCKLPAS